MSTLYTEEHESLDVSGGGIVLEYLYEGNAPKTVIVRVRMGDAVEPIAGAGPYTLQVEINGARVSPDSTVTVSSGVTEAIAQSRELVLIPNDEISVLLLGLPADTAITTEASLVDMSPLTRAEVYGSGAVSVDHNYGYADRYTYRTSAGAGVDNAQVQAFLREDYNAGRRSAAFVKGEIRTRPDGRWSTPMMLDPGDYILVFFKQGISGPDLAGLTVV